MATTRKILMVVENIPAPADRRVWPEAKALRDAGYQVSIICPKGYGQYGSMRSRTFALMALPFIAIDYLQLGINTLPTSRNTE